VHDIQIAATQYAFEPATIEVTAGESVRPVIRSKDVVHGFSIPDLKIEARIPHGGEPVTRRVRRSAARPMRHCVLGILWRRARPDESLPGERGLDWNSYHDAGDVRRRRRPIGVTKAVRRYPR